MHLWHHRLVFVLSSLAMLTACGNGWTMVIIKYRSIQKQAISLENRNNFWLWPFIDRLDGFKPVMDADQVVDPLRGTEQLTEPGERCSRR